MTDSSSRRRVPGDRLAPLYDLAAEAGIERSTAWPWLKNGELRKPVKIPGDRRVHVDRAAFLHALQAPTVAGGKAEGTTTPADIDPGPAQQLLMSGLVSLLGAATLRW